MLLVNSREIFGKKYICR